MKINIISESKNYSIKMIENPNLDQFSDLWKKFQNNRTLFMSFESVSSYLKNYRNIGNVILVALEKKDNKSIEAIFPLRKIKNLFYEKYLFLYPKLGFDFEPLTSLQNNEKALFMKTIFTKICTPTSFVSLEPVNQKFINEIIKLIKSTKLKFAQTNFSEHLYVLSLPENFQKLVDSFTGKFRKNLHYYQRKVMKDFSVSYENITNLKKNKKYYEKFLALHRDLIKEKGRLTPFEYKYFRDYNFDLVSDFENKAGLFSLKLNNKIVCMVFYADFGDTRYFLNIGVSTEYKKYSVARLLIIHVIEDAINKGLKYFNFGQGDEPYKENWGCEKFYNKKITIFSNRYLNIIDSSAEKIYDKIKYIMRMPFMKFPKKILMNLSLKRR
jgi:ribosomal protein S18 acetylase RimI-like enzyme